MIKLWAWMREGEARPDFHWLVDYDAKTKRRLSVLFPLNFVASAYCVVRNLKWQIEEKMYKAGSRLHSSAFYEGVEVGRKLTDWKDTR